jgi:hypothetical protein
VAKVVRFRSSEYLELMDGELPFVSIQPLSLLGSSLYRGRNFGGRICSDPSGGEVSVAPSPVPQGLVFQLDARAPKDAWMLMMEETFLREYDPQKVVTINARPLGDAVGDVPFEVQFICRGMQRLRDVDEKGMLRVNERFVRSVWRLEVWTWRMPATSAIEQLHICQQVDVEMMDLDNDEVLEQYSVNF